MDNWKLPTPHQVLATLMVMAGGIVTVGLFPDGSIWNKLAALATIVLGGAGVSAAAAYQPAHVKTILAAHDFEVRTALAAMPAPLPPPPSAAGTIGLIPILLLSSL